MSHFFRIKQQSERINESNAWKLKQQISADQLFYIDFQDLDN